jgi:hypothetical protein
VVAVSVVDVPGGHEAMPRHAAHRLEHALIRDVARRELTVHHRRPRIGETIIGRGCGRRARRRR